MAAYTRWSVWDRTTRLFHWINFLCVLTLAVFGLLILNADAFGVSSDGKVLLKTLHVYVGYVLAVNLAWRLVWAFIGGSHARWQALLPFRRGFSRSLRDYLGGMVRGRPPAYLGHNPAGRIMVTLLLLLLVSQAITGLVLAGTDLYKPPFGGYFAEWVTEGDPERLARLAPGSREHVDEAAYTDMRGFRSPFITVHLYGFYVIAVAVLLHIAAVIFSDIRERHGLVSAMFSGAKFLDAPPVDEESPSSSRVPAPDPPALDRERGSGAQ